MEWGKVSDIAEIIIGLALISLASYSIYKVLCHPLSNFPGPRLWGWSRLPFIFSLTTGTLQTRIKDFHEKYGPVVRVAPDELSFIDPAAWRDLYTTGNGHKGFPKTKVMSAEPDFVAITDANDTDHTRIRKLLQNAFSVQAVRDREHILQKYIGLLMRRLREQAESSDGSTTTVNVVQWYTFTTFDIAGDLVFSEPFDCLHNEIYHPWIRMIFSHLKASAFFMALRYYSPLDQWFLWSLPKSLLKEKEKFIGMSKDKVARRKKRDLPLSRTSDFMSLALNTAGEESMSIEEMEGTFGTLLIAGSETTATLLSGVTNYLCKLPEVRKRLEEEVRKSCPAENDITLTSTGGLPYLNAVLQEGLRMTPPVPSGSPRIVPPDGARVAGYWIPGGTAAAVTHWAAYQSAANFAHPDQFLPERWLKSNTSPEFASDVREVVQPFNAGGRNCIGQAYAWAEMRLILARMIWNFNISSDCNLKWPEQETYMMWQKEPFYVSLTPVRRNLA